MSTIEVTCTRCGFTEKISDTDGLHTCDHCGQEFPVDSRTGEGGHVEPTKEVPGWDIRSELENNALVFYPSKSDAVVTTFGGVAMLTLCWSAFATGFGGPWVTFLSIVAAIGTGFGASRFIGRKPDIIVNTRGFYTESLQAEWGQVAAVGDDWRGFPARRHIVFALTNGQQARIDLSRLDTGHTKAAKQIRDRINQHRPDLKPPKDVV